METRNHPTWMYVMGLGLILAAFGGVPLLAGSAALGSPLGTRAIAKVVLGALTMAYAVWLRRRASRA